MGKIYEGEIKLNTVQVCGKLGDAINGEQSLILGHELLKFTPRMNSMKKAFSHAVLDSYKGLPNTTEQDMDVKKMCKFLMEKHMKATTSMADEDSAFEVLINRIYEKADIASGTATPDDEE